MPSASCSCRRRPRCAVSKSSKYAADGAAQRPVAADAAPLTMSDTIDAPDYGSWPDDAVLRHKDMQASGTGRRDIERGFFDHQFGDGRGFRDIAAIGIEPVGDDALGRLLGVPKAFR